MRKLLYFVDPITRDVRSTPPSTLGRDLDSWESARAKFVQRWDALSQEEQQRLIEKALIERAANERTTAEPVSSEPREGGD